VWGFAVKPTIEGDGFVQLCAQLRQYFAWLGWFMVGKRQVGDVIIEGFSVRCAAGLAFVVVRGLDTQSMTCVVAFGRGESVRDALRNVTAAITKGQWKRDKFKTFI
jgi:hypothetical protein